MSSLTIGLSDRTTALSFVRNKLPKEQALSSELSRKPVYVIHATGANAGLTPGLRYADLQWQQMNLMMQMGPDQLKDAMEGAIRKYQGMDAGSRGNVIGLPVVAGMMAIWFPRAAKENGGAMP